MPRERHRCYRSTQSMGSRPSPSITQQIFFGSNFINDSVCIESALNGIRQRIVALSFKGDDELGFQAMPEVLGLGFSPTRAAIRASR